MRQPEPAFGGRAARFQGTIWDMDPASPGPAEPQPNKAAQYGCIAVLVLLAVIGGCTVLLGRDGDEPTAAGARSICQRFVKDRLKSPASADFSDVTASQSGGDWTVTGTVDSDNLFGAKVRNTFTCTVRPRSGDRDTWDLISLTGLVN